MAVNIANRAIKQNETERVGWMGVGSQGRQLSEDNVPGNSDKELLILRGVMLGTMEEEQRKQREPDPQEPWRSLVGSWFVL